MTEQKYISPLRFACVCASNVNRSMAAHKTLAKKNYNVSSYGTNSQVSIPSPNEKPNTYDFGTTYSEIVAALKEQDSATNGFYSSRGLIEMIERDSKIKEKPERFASTFESNSQKFFDIIFTYQRKWVFDKVIIDFHTHGNVHFDICHVINIETKDDNQNALTSAGCTLTLAQHFTEAVMNGKDITEEVESILNKVIEEEGFQLSYHCVTY